MLVADDDAEVRAAVTEYLRDHGLHVLEPENGLEALLHVKHEHPDAVVLDLSMPRLGGIETLKRIVKFDPTIAVVVVTGGADTALQRKASRLGVRATLAKPVNLPDLLPLLTRSDPARHDPVPGTEHP